ncbi:MAG TPA: winged helix-turn-helix domain-containing protein [Steroidobacteraceae bacterium]|nr:winged helix-turn-helix domain-containing protein [Steroidobacteraceae bacterium]
MDRLTTIPLRIGDWRLDPQLGQLMRGDQVEKLEARTLRLLQYLAARAGETVSIEELLDHVWSGVVVTQDSVYQAVTALRRLLGDDAKNPRYIVTVPRLGYRLVATVSPWMDDAAVYAAGIASEAAPRQRHKLSVGASVIGTVLVVVLGFAWWHSARLPAARSLAVLPFLDLTTQAMKEEYFADGLTEELINRLSKLPGFEVPAPSVSFHYKRSSLSPAQIADEVRVRYLLDGSLRETADGLRISARLVRAEDGFVVWAENYDRPKGDRVMIQDDIAEEVAGAIRSSVN